MPTQEAIRGGTRVLAPGGDLVTVFGVLIEDNHGKNRYSNYIYLELSEGRRFRIVQEGTGYSAWAVSDEFKQLRDQIATIVAGAAGANETADLRNLDIPPGHPHNPIKLILSHP